MNIPFERKVLLPLISIFVTYCLYLSWSYFFQNNDDAYISFRYGKNLMEGKGLVFNSGEYVEGYTNFLWTIIMAPFTKVPWIEVSVFAIVFGLLFSVLSIFVIIHITRNFTEKYQAYTPLLLILPVLFYSIDNGIAFWSVAGMEIPMYIFFTLLACLYYLRINNPDTNIYSLSAALILVTLTRPEGNIIFALTICHMIVFRKRIRDFNSKVSKLIVTYVIFISIYYAFKLYYYGQILPNTFYAKGVSDIGINLRAGYHYIKWCITERIYVLIFILFIGFKNFFYDFRYSYLASFVGIYLLYLVLIGGDWMMANRFFTPVIPFLYILSSIGIVKVFVFLDKYLSATKIIRIAVKVALVLLLALSLRPLAEYKLHPIYVTRNWEKQCSKFGQWLKMNVPSDTKIAVGAAGKIPYYSELYSIDIWGLNDKYIAGTPTRRIQIGHRKFDFDYIISRNPEFIIISGFDQFIPPSYERFDPDDKQFMSVEKTFRLKSQFK